MTRASRRQAVIAGKPSSPAIGASAALSLLLLAACQALPPGGQAKDAGADRAPAMQAAGRIDDQGARPVEVIAIPEPLPLPGQLKPLPDAGPAADAGQAAKAPARAGTGGPGGEGSDKDGRAGRAGLPGADDPLRKSRQAIRAARREPDAARFMNAIQVYPWHEGALYRLYARPGQISDITLEPGEQLISVSAGDTVRWVIGDTVSGQGEQERVHILVKPIEAGLETNLVITTDRRSYRLELESTSGTYMAALAWHYPQATLIRRLQESRKAIDSRPPDRGLDLQSLNFAYVIDGDTPSWRPLRAFDDGRKAYIEFPETIQLDMAPPLFVLAENGQAELTNYRLRGRYYIVDRLFAAAELRIGTAPQQIVRITRTGRRAVHDRDGARAAAASAGPGLGGPGVDWPGLDGPGTGSRP